MKNKQIYIWLEMITLLFYCRLLIYKLNVLENFTIKKSIQLRRIEIQVNELWCIEFYSLLRPTFKLLLHLTSTHFLNFNYEYLLLYKEVGASSNITLPLD
jgi:hypothetical protein